MSAELSGRALDAAVAVEVMGWLRLPEGENGFIDPAAPVHTSRIRSSVPPYSTSLDACAQAEARLMERGLGTAYAYALRDVVGPLIQEHQLPLILATAEQRCRAMLAAMREGGAQ